MENRFHPPEQSKVSAAFLSRATMQLQLLLSQEKPAILIGALEPAHQAILIRMGVDDCKIPGSCLARRFAKASYLTHIIIIIIVIKNTPRSS